MTTKALRKQLVAAIAMVLVAAVALGSSTYAWFAMNNTVEATNMQVKAVADQGILINEIATMNDTNWDNAATTSQTGSIDLHATSTANTATWFAAYSKVSNSAASASSTLNSVDLTADGYATLGTTTGFTTVDETVTAVAGSNAGHVITYVDSDGGSDYDNGEGYYVKYTYYIKSSAGAISCGTAADAQNFQIKEVNVTGNTNSAALDKALRVAVVVGGKAYIFAPLNDSAGTYYVGSAHTATTVKTAPQPTDVASIPATTGDSPLAVDVYLYFEGEDTNLKTDNVTSSLDNLTVNVKFSIEKLGSAVTPNGITVPTP